MSKKRMMSKQQRLYYEYSRKEKVREEIINMVKEMKEIESIKNSYKNSHFS